MPSPPRAVCIECCVSMKVKKVGNILEFMRPSGAALLQETTVPYFKIAADVYACPKCGHMVAVGFGSAPIAEHHDDNYGNFPVDFSIDA